MYRYLGKGLREWVWIAAGVAAGCILTAIQVLDPPSSSLWKYPLWAGIVISILISITRFIDLSINEEQPNEDRQSEKLANECEALATDISEFMKDRKAQRPEVAPNLEEGKINPDETYRSYKRNVDYTRITSNMYEKRFSFRIHHLVDELKDIGHSPDELVAFASDPLSDKRIETLVYYARLLRKGSLIKAAQPSKKDQEIVQSQDLSPDPRHR